MDYLGRRNYDLAAQQIGAAPIFPLYLPSGVRYVLGDLRASSALTTRAVSADTGLCVPFWFGSPFTISSIGIEVTTAGSGTAQVGIYSVVYNDAINYFVPDALIAQVGGLAINTNGFKETTLSFTFEPGAVYLAAVAVPSNVTLRALALAGLAIARFSGTTISAGSSFSASGGVLPTTLPFLTADTGTIPAIFVQR